ncbi:MAG: HEAT repeat domain-containing protein [Elusimicrobiota bacterium]|nr:HEAT repeat domain-containing protein [Elusimicrobiota bacterium]
MKNLLTGIMVTIIVLMAGMKAIAQEKADTSKQFQLLQSTSPALRRQAVSEIGELRTEKAIDRLGEVLQEDPNFTVRALAAEALGNMRDKRATSYLIDALGDVNRNVKASAIVSFGYIRDPKAVKPLIEFVKEEENVGLKISALNVLGVIGDSRAVTPLVEALENDNPRIRRIAAQSLGRLRDKESVDALIDAADDKNEGVRLFAVRALGEIGSEDAVKPLKKLLDDEENLEVKIAAAHALGQLGEDDGLSVALEAAASDKTDIKRKGLRALSAIGKVNEEVWSTVLGAYSSDDPGIKRDAETAASFLGIDLLEEHPEE